MVLSLIYSNNYYLDNYVKILLFNINSLILICNGLTYKILNMDYYMDY